MSIVVEHLTKKFDEQIAVNDISFSISQNQIVGFLGVNGAGKSTTMKIINGFIQPNAGKVNVCGIDVLKQPLLAQQKIGYLAEHNPLYADFYVREYLEFIASVHKLKQPKQRIEEVINMVNLQAEAKKKIEQLSKGYKQRVGIAGAILHDPEVLILDEPTSGLDPIQVAEIRQLIKNLGKSKTIIFSTHILQEVEALCSSIIIINKGNLIADDSLKVIQETLKNYFVIAKFKKQLNKLDFNDILKYCKNIFFHNYEWHFETSQIEITKKTIMEIATKNEWELETLFDKQNSLEDIFIRLAHQQN